METWTFSASPLLLTGMVMLWLIVTGLSWVHWRRRPQRAVAMMEGLRWATLTLILLTLAQPERVRREVRTEQPEIVVLHDESGSMETRDVVVAGSNVVSRRRWVESSLSTNFWSRWEASARVVVEGFARSDVGTNGQDHLAGTDLNGALRTVLERQRHLKAVLLLSDGDWNLGLSPLHAAGRMRAQRVPLFALSVGSDQPLPDLVLEAVSAPAYGLLGEQISLPFRVRSHMPRAVRTTVSLRDESGVVASQELAIAPFSEVQSSLLWMPPAVGDYVCTLSLPMEPGEYLAENNEQTFRLAVRTEKLKVLVIDSLPRWEYRYLRNALQRDPGVEVECLLLHPGMGAGQGTNYLPAFPAGREALAAYDVVFLGDVGLGTEELTESQADLLRGLVEMQASGLVFLPGRRGRLATLADTSLGELIPVILDDRQPKGWASSMETPIWLTASGQGHFLTRLAGNESQNASVWKGLPGFFWCAAVSRAKPGAEVLAVHPTQRGDYGRMPLLAIRPFGQGEVLFLGIDSAWRWRRGVEDKYHYRFWGQVVRWMAHKRHLAEGSGLRLTFTPEHPRAGDRIHLQAAVLDLLDWNPQEQIQAVITSPSQQTEQLNLQVVPGGWGVYQAQFQAELGGTYQVSLTGSRASRQLTAELQVTPATLEQVGQTANTAILREMAALTEGQSGGTDQLHELVHRIALLPEASPVERRFRLWANPWWGGFILLLLAIYWTARKAAGMV